MLFTDMYMHYLDSCDMNDKVRIYFTTRKTFATTVIWGQTQIFRFYSVLVPLFLHL